MVPQKTTYRPGYLPFRSPSPNFRPRQSNLRRNRSRRLRNTPRRTRSRSCSSSRRLRLNRRLGLLTTHTRQQYPRNHHHSHRINHLNHLVVFLSFATNQLHQSNLHANQVQTSLPEAESSDSTPPDKQPDRLAETVTAPDTYQAEHSSPHRKHSQPSPKSIPSSAPALPSSFATS
jgi:hypothetical protein